MEEDLQPSKGTVNRNRLTILLINGGTKVLQKFIVELLLNFFLQEKNENIKRQVGSVLYQQQFELLYPVDGHPPLIDTLPDILLSFIRHHVLDLQDEPGLQTHTSLLTSIKEYLSTKGFQRYLARRRHELEGNVKLRRSQFEALYSHSHPVTVNSLDITLLSFILVNTFTCEPTSGRWSEIPPPADVSIGDDVLRLRLIRNIILHQPLAETTDQEFEKNWSQVIEILGRRLGNGVEYDKLKEQNLDPEMDRQCRALLESWQKEEAEVKEALSELKESNEREHKETRALVMEGFTTTRGIIENQHKQSKEKMDRLEKRMERLEVQVEQSDFIQAQIPIWRKEDLVFCSTKAADAVLKKLESKNVVTIVGGPGCGKSMMSKHMALEYEQQGYKLHVLFRPEKVIELYSKDTKHVFMFDDPIGENIIDSELFNMWKKMDHGIRNVLQQNNVKVIITMRSTISNSRTVQEAETLFTTNLVNITRGKLKLSKKEKNAMFRRHCKSTPPEEIRGCMFDCFPLLCRVYNQSKTDKADIFTTPFQVLHRIFKTIQDDDTYQFCALVLCAVVMNFHDDLLDTFLTDASLSADRDYMDKVLYAMELKPHKSYSKIKTGLGLLCGIYIQKINGKYKFQHAIFKDIVLYLCGINSMGFTFKYFPSEMIRERVRIGNKLLTDSKEEFLLLFEDTEKIWNLLITRFQDDLKRWEFRDVFLSPYIELPKIKDRISEFITRNGAGLHDYDSNSMTILHWAVSVDILVNCVLETGIDINTRDSFGFSPLHYATMLDKTEMKRVFNEECDGNNTENQDSLDNFIDVAGKTKTWVAKNTNVDNVRLLLEKGADVNAEAKTGLSILVSALMFGNIGINGAAIEEPNCKSIFIQASANCMEIIKVLIDKGANVNANIENNLAPIFIGSIGNNVELVKMLIEKGADANVPGKGYLVPIIQAARHNNMEMLKLLLENGADVNVQSKDGMAAIICASEHNNMEMIKILIESGADVNVQSKDGMAAIICASEHNNMEMIKILIESGADVNAQTEDGMRAIIWASEHDNMDMLRLLILNGADVNAETEDGMRAIIWASEHNNMDMLRLLILNGADVNAETEDGMSAIIWASDYDNVEMLKILIENGADVNSQTTPGLTAMFWALEHDNMEMLKLLIENGADVNSEIEDGMTAIFWALEHDNVDMLKIFIENGADVNVQNEYGQAALIIATESNNIEIVKLFLENNADVNVQIKHGMTAIMIAIAANNNEMVKYFAENGADVNMQCENGSTALIYATMMIVRTKEQTSNNIELIKILLENGADVNMQCENGITALIYATMMIVRTKEQTSNNIELIKILLENGADVNMQCENGITALIYATMMIVRTKEQTSNNIELIKILLENGADVNIQCERGITALIYATVMIVMAKEQTSNNIELIKILLENGADVNVNAFLGITALIIATAANNLKMVKLLIKSGADVSKQLENGMTAIQYATTNDNSEMVEFLIENGADSNVQTGGKTKINCS